MMDTELISMTQDSQLCQASSSSTIEPSHSPAMPSSPLAIIHGEVIDVLPMDLYIPPDAMRVLLENFTGPLDLLLYLIKKQNINLLDIPIAEVTRQYLNYIKLMQHFMIELAADYLVMAAMLAEMKSRLLLPRPEELTEAGSEETDPRMALARRLQEYAQFKEAALQISQLPCLNHDYFILQVNMPAIPPVLPSVTVVALQQAFAAVMKRINIRQSHQVVLEPITVQDKMIFMLQQVTTGKRLLTQLLCSREGRLGIVVSFLALLELMKQKQLSCCQTTAFGPISLERTVSHASN